MAKKKNPGMKEAFQFLQMPQASEILKQTETIGKIRANREKAKSYYAQFTPKALAKRANTNASIGFKRLADRIWNQNLCYRFTWSNGHVEYAKGDGHHYNIVSPWAEVLGKSSDRYWVKHGGRYFILTTENKRGFCEYFDILSNRTDKVVATCKVEVIRRPYGIEG